jgi:hypothetical protein
MRCKVLYGTSLVILYTAICTNNKGGPLCFREDKGSRALAVTVATEVYPDTEATRRYTTSGHAADWNAGKFKGGVSQ